MAAFSSVESTSDVPEEWAKWNQRADDLVNHFEMMGGCDDSIMGDWAQALACLIESKPKDFRIERPNEQNCFHQENKVEENEWTVEEERCKFTKEEGTNRITKPRQNGFGSSSSSKKETSFAKILSEYLTCPISMEIIEDPIAMPCCGALFSQKSIFRAFEHNISCPHCRARYDPGCGKFPIVPNIKSIIGICKEREIQVRSALPPPAKKRKREIHCSNCHEVGHTKRTCKTISPSMSP